MILRIDPFKVSEELAFADSQEYINGKDQADGNYTLGEVKSMIQEIDKDQPVYPNLYEFFTSKFDYYFEILTNNAL